MTADLKRTSETMNPNELALDHAFWQALSGNEEFRGSLLMKSKFSGLQPELVTDELWHQRWYRDPETGKDSETDILLMWRSPTTGERVAIHIENKPAHRKWEPSQAANYRRRAENRKAKWRYTDFEVALVAPLGFVAQHLGEARQFDFVMSYEEIGEYVPEFAAAALLASPPTTPSELLGAHLLKKPIGLEELAERPWLADVRMGQFAAIPPDIGWADSASLAYLINGYDLFGVDRLQRLANDRLAAALDGTGWRGDPVELWACLFGGHAYARHSGYGPEGEVLRAYDDLCQALRAGLVALD